MSGDAVDVIRAIVRDELDGFKTADVGVVTASYSHESASDDNNCECDVRLRDSGLELKRVPVGTGRVGAVAIPNVDDLVVVQFLHGDIHAPLITSRVHNDVDRSPEAKAREFVYVSPDSAESGVRRVYAELPNANKLLVDDDKMVLEMGRTTLTLKHDGEAELKSNDQTITLTDQNGNNVLRIIVQQGTVRVQGQTKVVVEAPQIELVDSASHPLVFGDQLIQYLNQVWTTYQTHTHPGEMALGVFPVTPAPPVPPLPPATPSLLSMRVKTG